MGGLFYFGGITNDPFWRAWRTDGTAAGTFMLADAKDARGDPWAIKLQALAGQGVSFKVCNNTLKSRGLGPEVVAKEATVVPSAVNEIIRLQTREGYAYFNHVK